MQTTHRHSFSIHQNSKVLSSNWQKYRPKWRNYSNIISSNINAKYSCTLSESVSSFTALPMTHVTSLRMSCKISFLRLRSCDSLFFRATSTKQLPYSFASFALAEACETRGRRANLFSRRSRGKLWSAEERAPKERHRGPISRARCVLSLFSPLNITRSWMRRWDHKSNERGEGEKKRSLSERLL